jgi:hypothetical protein
MIVLILPLGLAAPLSLSEAQFFNSSNISGGKPILLALCAQHSPACAALEEILDQAANAPEFANSVEFVSVECSPISSQCARLGPGPVPKLVYFDSLTKESVLFTGARELPDLSAFVRAQLSFPIVFIESSDALPKATQTASFFVFKYSNRSDSKFTVLQKSFAQFRDLGSAVYALPASKASLAAFRSTSVHVPFNGQWTEADLAQFFRRTIWPLLSEFTIISIQQLRKHRVSAVIAFIDPALYEVDLAHIAQELETDYPVMFVDTASESLLARMLGVRIVDEQPAIILYDPAGDRWLPYAGEFTDTGIRKWLAGESSALEWRRPLQGPKSLIGQSLSKRGSGMYLIVGLAAIVALLAMQLGCKCRAKRRPGVYSKL